MSFVPHLLEVVTIMDEDLWADYDDAVVTALDDLSWDERTDCVKQLRRTSYIALRSLSLLTAIARTPSTPRP
jgi:hypothetical protein